MQPEDIAFLLVLLLVVGAGAFLAWERHTMCVAFIEGDLLRAHEPGPFGEDVVYWMAGKPGTPTDPDGYKLTIASLQ